MAARRPTADRSSYQKTVLDNGLRIVTEKMSSVRSVSLGVWIDVGSRNERPEESGASHFIEHMVFKGTKRRTARQIAAELESLGGSLNAFTSREQTCFAARILDEHLEVAVDVLADLTCNATLTPVNIRREKMVVCEEIKEVQDNPSDHIHDIFSETYWGDHPLGRSILGTRETVTGMQRRQIVNYLKRHYRAGSTVIAAAGCVSHRKLVRLVKEKFHFPSGEAEKAEKAFRNASKTLNFAAKGNSQTHLCLGYPGLEYTAGEKMAVLALGTYLGGGMSSVLFQKIREDRGLAYAVYTFHDFYRDAGVFGAYLGTDEKHVKQALEIILAEFERVRKRRLSNSKLDTIKGQMKGQLVLGMESTANRMNRLARQELMNQSNQSYKQMLKSVDKIASSQILELSNRIIDNDNIAVAVLGPADKQVFDDVL
jgi:predicted Zn-dependent peptidase